MTDTPPPIFVKDEILYDAEGNPKMRVVRNVYRHDPVESMDFLDLETGHPPIKHDAIPDWMHEEADRRGVRVTSL